MKDLVDELYFELDSIFKEYTTNEWKNGWRHEGDRESKELTIQKEVSYNNIFLLQKDMRGDASFTLQGASLELSGSLSDGGEASVRFDIKSESIHRAYYYITEDKWKAHKLFIIDLCKRIYDSAISSRKYLDRLPDIINGEINPDFFIKFIREDNIEKLLKPSVNK